MGSCRENVWSSLWGTAPRIRTNSSTPTRYPMYPTPEPSARYIIRSAGCKILLDYEWHNHTHLCCNKKKKFNPHSEYFIFYIKNVQDCSNPVHFTLVRKYGLGQRSNFLSAVPRKFTAFCNRSMHPHKHTYAGGVPDCWGLQLLYIQLRGHDVLSLQIQVQDTLYIPYFRYRIHCTSHSIGTAYAVHLIL